MTIIEFPSLPLWFTSNIEEKEPQKKLNWCEPRTRSFGVSKKDYHKNNTPLLSQFSNVLLLGEFVDLKTINLAGSVITLPRGVSLYKSFRKHIELTYSENKLVEYSYPSLLPCEVFNATSEIFNMKNKIFKVGIDADFSNSTPIAALSPTGEAAIYTHWSKVVNTIFDLPIQMYQEAIYYRPYSKNKSSSNTIFRSQESTGVYEFHCCYSDREQAITPLKRYKKMINSICHHIGLPVFWSIRPRWSNNSAVASATLAADLLLPTGKTVQLAAIYDQGERFSQKYDIKTKQSGKSQFTYQISGYCSKRMPLSHLFWSMKNNYLVIDPLLAPEQIGVFFKKTEEDQLKLSQEFMKYLKKKGLRVLSPEKLQNKNVSKVIKLCKAAGIPMCIIIDCSDNLKFRCILTRNDTDQEIEITVSKLTDLLPNIKLALKEISISWRNNVIQALKNKIISVTKFNKKTAQDISDGKMVICPLKFDEKTTRQIDNLVSGEVIGFVKSTLSQPCVITGQLVNTLGLISRRV